MAKAIKDCVDEPIKIGKISENGKENQDGLFFDTDKTFVQINEDAKEIEKTAFSMGYQGMLNRITFDEKSCAESQELFDLIMITCVNAPHKYEGIPQALFAALGKQCEGLLTREFVPEGNVFEGFTMTTGGRYVAKRLHITKATPSKHAMRFIDKIKPKETNDDITI